MPLLQRLMDMPFFQSWLPDRLKPVNDEYISDQYSQGLFRESEKLIDDVIELSEIERNNRVFKRKTNEYKMLLKIKKKRIKLDISDQKRSEAPIKKRVIIDIYRKIYKSKNGVGKVIEATIYYTYQGQSYVRSLKRSPFIQRLFYKLDMLDDALIGRLVKSNQDLNIVAHKSSDEQDEIQNFLLDMKRVTKQNNQYLLDPIIEDRLKKIITSIECLIPDMDLLEIEERHVVKRILKDDIPNLLHSYFALSVQKQLEQKENVFLALSRIELTILQYIKNLEKIKLERMEHLLRLNKARYEKK